MQPRTIRLIGAIAGLAVAIPVFAQYGHPLKGSWSGDWWIVKGKENHILLDFNWDGKTLTGTLNPGPDASPMQKLTLTPPDVINAGKTAIAARDAGLAKQAADAAAASANPPAAAAGTAPAATAGSATKGGANPASAVARPENKQSAASQADAELYKAHPDLSGRKLTLDAKDADLRKEWNEYYRRVQPASGNAPAIGGAQGTVASSANAGTVSNGSNRQGAPAVKDNIAIAGDPWLLHFEADAKDPSGKTVHYVVDGKMENLGSAYSRVITGTWKTGSQVGNFKVVRN